MRLTFGTCCLTSRAACRTYTNFWGMSCAIAWTAVGVDDERGRGRAAGIRAQHLAPRHGSTHHRRHVVVRDPGPRLDDRAQADWIPRAPARPQAFGRGDRDEPLSFGARDGGQIP